MAMVPAAAPPAALGLLREFLPHWPAAGLWEMSVLQLFCLAAGWDSGLAGGLRTPFSRRWRIAPGTLPASGERRLLCLTLIG
jgi:hypothetical protein